jgi:four helix bundle protein
MKSDLPERTFAFAERIVRLCLFLEKEGVVSTTLMKQILRSGTSIGANVEEGQASESKKDFVHKYSLALKEARETHYWLRLLVAAEVVPAVRIASLTDEANELVAILTTICKKNRD